MQGYIPLQRKILGWQWYTDVNTCHLFIHLLLNANHEEKHWRGVKVLPGQLITGRESLSANTGLSVQQVRTALGKLKSSGEITSKTTNKSSLITITNWLDYQVNNHKVTSEITIKQPASNQQVTTTNNDKNDKNDKKNIALQDVRLCDLAQWAQKNQYPLDRIESQIATCQDWHAAKGKKVKDGVATVRNWLRKDLQFNPIAKQEKSNVQTF